MRKMLVSALCALLCLMLPLAALAFEEWEEGPLPSFCLPVRLCETAPEDALMAEAAAQAGLQALLSRHGMQEEIAALPFVTHTHQVIMSDGQTAWIVSLFSQLDEHPLEAVITLDARTGELLRCEENSMGWFRLAQLHWEEAYGRYGVWPLEKQLLFDQLYCMEVTHALPPEGSVTEAEAIDIALKAAGLESTRDTLRFDRALALQLYAASPADTYVWMITLCLGDEALAQVNLSASDGHVLDVFDLGGGVG